MLCGALTLVAGCSALRIGYSTAPDLVYWWLDRYVDFNGHQTVRVLTPWRVPDRPAVAAVQPVAVKAPVQITLVQTNADILRGSAWRVAPYCSMFCKPRVNWGRTASW